ncbi:MAG: hypothetical protein KatS3mg087_1786 [Patescibacteria group bacterium]|nr:MAG: hypothetical protein KatS3mg087_1786 [Patescibacteria group bacterium]
MATQTTTKNRKGRPAGAKTTYIAITSLGAGWYPLVIGRNRDEVMEKAMEEIKGYDLKSDTERKNLRVLSITQAQKLLKLYGADFWQFVEFYVVHGFAKDIR